MLFFFFLRRSNFFPPISVLEYRKQIKIVPQRCVYRVLSTQTTIKKKKKQLCMVKSGLYCIKMYDRGIFRSQIKCLSGCTDCCGVYAPRKCQDRMREDVRIFNIKSDKTYVPKTVSTYEIYTAKKMIEMNKKSIQVVYLNYITQL